MSTRNKKAAICQGGASNARRVTLCLLEALDDCRLENKPEQEDAAVFLILHQLTRILTGHDFTIGNKHMSELWSKYSKEIEV